MSTSLLLAEEKDSDLKLLSGWDPEKLLSSIVREDKAWTAGRRGSSSDETPCDICGSEAYQLGKLPTVGPSPH